MGQFAYFCTNAAVFLSLQLYKDLKFSRENLLVSEDRWAIFEYKSQWLKPKRVVSCLCYVYNCSHSGPRQTEAPLPYHPVLPKGRRESEESALDASSQKVCSPHVSLAELVT